MDFIKASGSSAADERRRAKVASLCAVAEELAALCLRLGDDVEVQCTVMEVRCLEPGCPPMETGFAVLNAGVDCKWKVQKALVDVTRDDIVDGLQAMLRGEAPPCACDIVMGGGEREASAAGTSTSEFGGGTAADAGSVGREEDGGPTMEEVELMGMMDMMTVGTL